MSKKEANLLALAILGAAVIGSVLLIDWLQSTPDCNAGCRTQLEHLKEHVIKDAIQAALPQIGSFFA
jgi:hypothetical protein